MFLNANQPSSRPGVKPSSLVIWRHRNIAHFYLFFNSNGEFPGKKFPSKVNYVNIRIEACGYTKITFLYQKRTEAVSLKLTNFIPSTSGVSSPA